MAQAIKELDFEIEKIQQRKSRLIKEAKVIDLQKKSGSII